MLDLDISTVRELPGHHSFHVSSHPSWKDVKKTALQLYNLAIFILCDWVSNQTGADVSGRKNLRNSTKQSVATRQQWRLLFCPEWVFSKKIRHQLICTTRVTTGISFPKEAFFCWKAPCHLRGGRRRLRGAQRLMGFLIRNGTAVTSEVAPTVKILSLSQGGTFISPLCQCFRFSDFEFSANLISTAVNSS